MARDYNGNVAGFGNNNSGNTATFQNINWDNITANNPNLGYVLEFAQSQAYLSGNQTSSTSQFVGVTRPKNVAYNYIFRAA